MSPLKWNVESVAFLGGILWLVILLGAIAVSWWGNYNYVPTTTHHPIIQMIYDSCLDESARTEKLMDCLYDNGIRFSLEIGDE